MRMFTKIFAGAAGAAALATAAPAMAQYYGYAPRYAQPYGYGYNSNVTNVAAQQCTAAVQSRLNTRVGLGGVIGAMIGARPSTGRVLQVTRVDPNRRTVTVRGLATSGQAYAYSPYGYGAYGAVGYNYRPDLTFKCSVDYRGYVRDVDINRR